MCADTLVARELSSLRDDGLAIGKWAPDEGSEDGGLGRHVEQVWSMTAAGAVELEQLRQAASDERKRQQPCVRACGWARLVGAAARAHAAGVGSVAVNRELLTQSRSPGLLAAR